jgi:hypothetical protein
MSEGGSALSHISNTRRSYLSTMASMASSSILTVPPELFDAIADRLPLRAKASTLLSLALSNSQIYTRARPILYRHLNLVDCDVSRSSAVLTRLKDPTETLGTYVQGLYLLCSRLEGSHASPTTLLKELISRGRLLHLRCLELFYSGDLEPDSTSTAALPAAQTVQEIEAEVWDLVQEGCPLLRSLSVHGWDGTPSAGYTLSGDGVCTSSFWKLEVSMRTWAYTNILISAFVPRV